MLNLVYDRRSMVQSGPASLAAATAPAPVLEFAAAILY